MSDYYRPTPGEHVGTWNVFPKNGPARRGVPFEELPEEVKAMIRGTRWS